MCGRCPCMSSCFCLMSAEILTSSNLEVCVSVCEGVFSSMGGRGPDGSGIKGTSVNNICLFPCLISGITTVNACIVLDYKSTYDV